MSLETLFYHKMQNQFNSYLQKSEENLSKRERAKHLHGASPCLHNSYWTFPTSDLCLKTVLSKPTEMQRNTKIITSTTKTTSIHKLQLFQLIHSQQQRVILKLCYNCTVQLYIAVVKDQNQRQSLITKVSRRGKVSFTFRSFVIRVERDSCVVIFKFPPTKMLFSARKVYHGEIGK